jgi:hypothetical protein
MNRLLQLITGKDNTTWDLGRFSWALSFVAVIAHEAFQLAHNAGASVRDFALALAAVSAAHGAAIGMKAKTEPGGEA